MKSAPATPKRSDRRRMLITPEGIALPVTLASRGTRFGALLIDLTIIVVAMIVSAFGLYYAASKIMQMNGQSLAKSDPTMPGAVQFALIVYIALLFLLRHAYFLYFELGPRGATPGKRMTGVRVAARDGGRLTTEMVLARNLLRDVEITLPIVALFSLIGGGLAEWAALGWLAVFALFPLFNRDRLRPGDLIAGTWVVHAPKRTLLRDLASDSSASDGRFAFTRAQVEAYGVKELHVLEDVLRQGDRRVMQAVADRIRRKIGWIEGREEADGDFLSAYYAALRGRLESRLLFGKRKRDKFDQT